MNARMQGRIRYERRLGVPRDNDVDICPVWVEGLWDAGSVRFIESSDHRRWACQLRNHNIDRAPWGRGT